jgi:hypothetical protein
VVSELDIAKGADRRARERFTYQADRLSLDSAGGITADQWRSHHDDVLAGRGWSGDCDDLGSTVLMLASLAGVSATRLYRARVKSPDNPAGADFDHFIGLYHAPDDSWHTLGDTYGPSQPLGQSGHKLHSIACVADGLHAWTSAS